jgi:regulator of ribonuclease activity A
MGSITADLMDASGGAHQSCETQFRQFGGGATFEGTLRTVRCDGDTVLVKQVLAEPGGGQVLVIDGGGSLYCALMGDLTAGKAVSMGWSGIVVHGAVRDTEALRELPIGIKALGTSPRKPRQEGTGEIDADVSFGGVTFRPGRMVWSDADGLITPAL